MPVEAHAVTAHQFQHGQVEPGSDMLTVRAQAKICFDKFFVVYWRTPEYNATRFGFSVGVALMFGTIVWKYGANVYAAQPLHLLF